MVNKLKNTGIGITPEATLIFFVLHIFIALPTKVSSAFSTYYALTIFIIGALAALSGKDSVVVCIISYIVGAEVLWRMTRADVFWEFGKYAISGILILALLVRSKRVRPAMGLILYFLLLLPAISKTPYESWTQWREVVSFNMSGPLSICLCGLYFSGLTLDKKDLRRIFAWLIAPVISIAVLILLTLGKAPAAGVVWRATSGGFAPNQASSILGLGVFLCIVSSILAERERIFKIIFISISIWFLSHAILTCSRGGVLGSGLSVLVFLLFVIKNKKNRLSVLCLGIFVIPLLYFYLIPKLDQYTHGGLRAKYAAREKIGELEVIDTTGRTEIMLSDIAIFRNNIYGVGVGNSPGVRHETTRIEAGAHTEWTRMLAEHGILGLFSLIFLWIWLFSRYRSYSIGGSLSKAIALSFIVGFTFYMGHSAMRLVIPSFMAGLLGANLKLAK